MYLYAQVTIRIKALVETDKILDELFLILYLPFIALEDQTNISHKASETLLVKLTLLDCSSSLKKCKAGVMMKRKVTMIRIHMIQV